MPEANPSPLNPFKKTTASLRRVLIITILAFLVAVGSTVFCGLVWKKVRNTTKEIDAYTLKMKQKTEDTSRSFESQLNNLQDKISDAEERLNRLSSLSLQSHEQRALSEAAYLIHVANLHLLIGQDPDSALRALQVAHNQLKQVANPAALSLKQTLANDIVKLEKMPRFDIAKLLARLQSLKEDVAKLPSLPTQALTPQDDSTTNTEPTDTSPWYKKLGHSLSGLKDLVIIRHDRKDIKPLLSPEQLMFLKQNVQLKISEAEWAVLHQNVSIYMQGLNAAKQQLNAHYPNQQAMASVIKEIDALLTINIRPKLPSLMETMQILHSTSLLSHSKKKPKPIKTEPNTQPGVQQ